MVSWTIPASKFPRICRRWSGRQAWAWAWWKPPFAWLAMFAWAESERAAVRTSITPKGYLYLWVGWTYTITSLILVKFLSRKWGSWDNEVEHKSTSLSALSSSVPLIKSPNDLSLPCTSFKFAMFMSRSCMLVWVLIKLENLGLVGPIVFMHLYMWLS
jgi:hypothetical protein